MITITKTKQFYGSFNEALLAINIKKTITNSILITDMIPNPTPLIQKSQPNTEPTFNCIYAENLLRPRLKSQLLKTQ